MSDDLSKETNAAIVLNQFNIQQQCQYTEAFFVLIMFVLF